MITMEQETVDAISDEMLRLGEKWTAEDTPNKTECLGLIVTLFARRIKEAWKHERDELVYSFDPTKAAKSKAPDPSAYEMDGLMRDPAYREIFSDGRNEENKPKSDWTMREALDFANTLANHGWTREANSDAASSCIYALCRMLKGHGNAAAMREALVFLRDKELSLLECNVRHCIGLSVFGLEQTCKIMRGMIEEALSAPPRNCDVGTAEEQSERFMDFCRPGNRPPNCEKCKVYRKRLNKFWCQLEWAQRPYEEGGEK